MCGVILEELDSIALTVLKSFQIKIYYKLAEPDFQNLAGVVCSERGHRCVERFWKS